MNHNNDLPPMPPEVANAIATALAVALGDFAHAIQNGDRRTAFAIFRSITRLNREDALMVFDAFWQPLAARAAYGLGTGHALDLAAEVTGVDQAEIVRRAAKAVRDKGPQKGAQRPQKAPKPQALPLLLAAPKPDPHGSN